MHKILNATALQVIKIFCLNRMTMIVHTSKYDKSSCVENRALKDLKISKMLNTFNIQQRLIF